MPKTILKKKENKEGLAIAEIDIYHKVTEPNQQVLAQEKPNTWVEHNRNIISIADCMWEWYV